MYNVGEYYTMKSLTLFQKQQRQVIQFQFMDWPDQGVPSSSTTFLNLVEHVSNINTPKTPIVVHCR
jgi:protein tyrosine phosphatase